MRHALAGKPEEIRSQGAAAIGERCGLAGVEQVHPAPDGEHWRRDGERCFPPAKTTLHLDPFHANRAIMPCFGDAGMARNVIDAPNDGDEKEAIALLGACEGLGVASAKRTGKAIAYLEGPSLGAMGSGNRHPYGARMDCRPCAWSMQGASGMARVISRRASERAIPKMTRGRSAGETGRRRRERRELRFHGGQGIPASAVLKSSGRGHLPPRQADTGKMDPGKAYALCKGTANMDRGI